MDIKRVLQLRQRSHCLRCVGIKHDQAVQAVLMGDTAAAQAMAGTVPMVLLSGGTDGTDGPTDAAGAIVDHTTAQRAAQLGMDIETHLKRNDAYSFFQQLGDLLITGPTRTNVMDLRVMLIGKTPSSQQV